MMRKRAFTLVEVMAAVGILAVVLAISGTIFRVAVNSHRMAAAHAEILQKLRTITTQLEADFDGLLKDQEIFMAWVDPCEGDPNRFDRIMFFSSTGDFQAYHSQAEGDVARISYMIANDVNHPDKQIQAYDQPARARVLARTQHIMVSSNADLQDPNFLTDGQWLDWHNNQEIEGMVVNKIGQWKQLPPAVKTRAIRAVTDIDMEHQTLGNGGQGTHVHLREREGITASIHKVLCEGVGQFKIQGWYEYDDPAHPYLPRWVPEMKVERDGVDDTSDFFSLKDAMAYVYWSSPNATIHLGGEFNGQQALGPVSLNRVPGLGRALKFTFTLYDSRGLVKGGRTYSHIIYLDK